MPERVISTKLAVEGEEESREAVKGYTDDYKVLRSELKLVESQYKDNADSMEALTAKGNVLQKMYENQAAKVAEMEKAMQNAREAEQQHGAAAEELRAKLESLQAALKQGEDGFEQISQATGKSITSTGQAKDAIAELQAQLSMLEAKQKAAAKGATDWQISTNYAKAELNDLGAKVKENSAKINEFGNETKEAAENTDLLGELGSMAASKIGSAFTAAGIVSIIAGIGAEIIKTYEEFEAAKIKITQGTGETGDTLNELMTSAKNIYRGVSESIGTVAEAIADVNTRLGLTGEGLEYITEQILKFSKATGESTSNAVDYISSLKYAYGLAEKDIPRILDILTVASQNSGASAAELAEAALSGSYVFKEYNYSLEGVIGQLAAFEKVGVSSQTVVKDMKKVYEDGKMTWDEFIYSIQNGTTTAKEAYEMFGAEGDYLASVVKNADFNIMAMTKSLYNIPEAMEKTYESSLTVGDKLKIFWNNIYEAFQADHDRRSAQLGKGSGNHVVSVIAKEISDTKSAMTKALEDPEGAAAAAKNTADGYLNYMDANRKAFYDAGYANAKAVQEGYAAGSDQHSPSRKAAEQAANDIAGYMQGYRENQAALYATSAETATKTLAAYKEAYARELAAYRDNELTAAMTLASSYSIPSRPAAPSIDTGSIIKAISNITINSRGPSGRIDVHFKGDDLLGDQFARAMTPKIMHEIQRLGDSEVAIRWNDR